MENSPAQKSSENAPHLALIAVQIFFGSLPVVGKVVLKTIPPLSLVGFRVGLTALALLVVQLWRGELWLENKRDYWSLFVLSVFGVTLNQILFITGLSLTKASNTSLLAVTIPIFTLTIGSLFGIERLRKIKVLGIVLAAVGVILLIDPRNASFSSETTRGDFLIILNSLSYGIYVVISKKVITRNGAIRSIAWVFIFASLFCVPLGAYSLTAIDLTTIPPIIWWAILYVAFISTTLPYIFNAWALARVNPSVVAVYIYLQPLIGFVLAVIFLSEPVDFKVLIAAVLIFGGVFLTSRKNKQANITELS